MMDKIYNNQLTGKLIGCGKHIGFKYYIVTFGTHPCAYVMIHPGNDLYGVDYTYINGIACHGGLTYSDNFVQLKNMKLVGGWFIGWDYAHAGYFVKCTPFSEEIGGKKWTIDEIKMECKNVIDQIIRGDYEIWKD